MISVKARLTVLGFCVSLLVGAVIWASVSLFGNKLIAIAAGALMGVMLGTLFFYLLAGSLSNTINNLINYSDQIVQGDLTQSSQTKLVGEFKILGQNFEKLCIGLGTYFSRSLKHVETLDLISGHISASTEQINRGTLEQTTQVHQLLVSVEEFAAGAKHSVEEAEVASQVAENTHSAARSGGEALEKVVKGMNLINSRMAELGENSSKVGQITGVIDDIAAQTNLLALNAAIESARAGEQGRGFAVVAEEVRHLAESSGNATKEIIKLINTIQQNTGEAIDAVKQDVGLIKEANESFRSIRSLITTTLNTIQDLAESARSQAATSAESVNNAKAIVTVTKETASITEETAAVAVNLSELSKRIKKVISIFKLKAGEG